MCELIRQATKRKQKLGEIAGVNFSVNAGSSVVIKGNIKPGGHGIAVGDYAQVRYVCK